MEPMATALSASPSPKGVEEYVTTIAVHDGASIPLHIHRPSPALSQSPLIVWYHAGGYCVGGPELSMPVCRNLVQKFGAVVVNVGYRHAPEHKFPTPINDCWDALKWVADHTIELQADPSKGFIIGGESSGGNASAVLAHLARDNQLSPPLTGQFLSVASCLPPETVPEKYRPFYHSWEQAEASHKLFNYDMTVIFRQAHRPDMRSPLFGAFNDPRGHAGLPPAYFQICGIDPVRDEGFIYERVLREEYGIKTKMDLYSGLPHAFWQLFPTLKASQKAKEDAMKGFTWLLEGSL